MNVAFDNTLNETRSLQHKQGKEHLHRATTRSTAEFAFSGRFTHMNRYKINPSPLQKVIRFGLLVDSKDKGN
jgi:hypothetical protein